MVKIGTVWDRTAEFVTDNLTAIVPIALLAFFVPFSIQGNFAHASDNAGPNLALMLQLVALGFSVLAIWGSLAIVAMALGGSDPQAPTARAIATRRLLPALTVWVSLFLAIVALPSAVLVAISGDDGSAAMRGATEVVSGGNDIVALVRSGVILYVVVILVPLLWLGARLMVVSPAIVAERKWLGAIPRSFALTRGLTVALIGVLLLYILVTQVAVLATQTVFGSIFSLVAGPADGGLSLTQVLTSVMVATVKTAFAVLAPAFMAKLYLALTQHEAAARP